MLISGKDANGDIIPVQVDANGALATSGAVGGTQVQGTAATGAPATGNPVLVGGEDTTGNVQPLAMQAFSTVNATASPVVTEQRVAADMMVQDAADNQTNRVRSAKDALVGSGGGSATASAPLLWDPVTAKFWPQEGTQTGGGFVQGPAAAGTAVAGNPVLLGASDGTNAQGLIVQAAANPNLRVTLYTGGNIIGGAGNGGADSLPATFNGYGVLAYSLGYNGLTFDRLRSNVDVTLLASAARTTTQTSADIVTYNAHSLIVTLDMTVVGTGSVTLAINYKDPASGKYIPLLTGLAVTTNSTNMYTVNRHIPAVANVNAQKDLGRIIQIVVTANNANPATYSVGYTLVC